MPLLLPAQKDVCVGAVINTSHEDRLKFFNRGLYRDQEKEGRICWWVYNVQTDEVWRTMLSVGINQTIFICFTLRHYFPLNSFFNHCSANVSLFSYFRTHCCVSLFPPVSNHSSLVLLLCLSVCVVIWLCSSNLPLSPAFYWPKVSKFVFWFSHYVPAKSHYRLVSQVLLFLVLNREFNLSFGTTMWGYIKLRLRLRLKAIPMQKPS